MAVLIMATLATLGATRDLDNKELLDTDLSGPRLYVATLCCEPMG